MSRNRILICMGAIVLCFAGFNNKFPLLLPGSETYIHAGFTRQVPLDSTALYGLFITHASWGRSLWLVILTQALLLSLILYYYFRYFSRHPHFAMFYLACLFFITFMTLASVTVSTIGVGIFAGISILCGGLLLFAHDLSKRDRYIMAIALVMSAAMDLTHLVVLICISLSYTLGLLCFKTSPWIKTNFRNVAILMTLTITAALMIASIHFLLGGGFSVVRDHQMPVPPQLTQLRPIHTDIKMIEDTLSEETIKSIYTWYNEDAREFSITRQAGGWLDLQYQDYGQSMVIVACLSIYGWTLVRKTRLRHPSLFVYVLTACLMYALTSVLIYGGGGMQWQVAWMVSIPLFILVAEVNDIAS